jgi:transcriptional regulator with XRE-family HTH domain
MGEIERGEKRPSFDTILALAEALETSPAEFFEFDKEEWNDKAPRKRIDSLIGKTNAEQLQLAYRVLRALLEP